MLGLSRHLQDHQYTEPTSTKYILQCNKCGVSFKQYCTLYKHEKTCNGGKQNQVSCVFSFIVHLNYRRERAKTDVVVFIWFLLRSFLRSVFAQLLESRPTHRSAAPPHNRAKQVLLQISTTNTSHLAFHNHFFKHPQLSTFRHRNRPKPAALRKCQKPKHLSHTCWFLRRHSSEQQPSQLQQF